MRGQQHYILVTTIIYKEKIYYHLNLLFNILEDPSTALEVVGGGGLIVVIMFDGNLREDIYFYDDFTAKYSIVIDNASNVIVHTQHLIV